MPATRLLLSVVFEKMKVSAVNPQDAWNVAFSQLELQLDRASFNTWLRGATFLGYEGDTFVIGVRNSYARDMLEHRLYRNIWRILSDVVGKSIELRFEVNRIETAPLPQANEEPPLFRLLAQQDHEVPAAPLHQFVTRPQRPELPDSELNDRFNFDRFIVNQSNRMVYEAARAVSERPAIYNPFLIYGGVGLGKTHLLHAIAHDLRKRGLHVIYISSEAFTNDLIDSIRQRTTAMFRDKYRTADVLLVDDIQFIAGKESTQEEFFHTFNALYTFNKQIILASDRHPSELTMLEDRLRSRFEGGLIMDVQPPELETRIAILEMWSLERSLSFPRQVLEMVAQRAQSNVRELEGIFNQIMAKTRLGEEPLTMLSAERTLERYERPREHITIKQVLEATAKQFRISMADLTGKRRAQRFNQARQVAMYLAREITDASLGQIGEIFGGRSHTTVLHGCNKIIEEMTIDTRLCAAVEQIRHQLQKDD